MRLRAGLALLSVVLLTVSCAGPLGRQYEYEERLYLSVDGAATVILNASVPALVALRGLALDPDPSARLDRQTVRSVFEAEACQVTSVGQPWRRDGRRFVQVRIEAEDVRALSSCGALDWSVYGFELEGVDRELIRFRQAIGAPSGGDPGDVEWTGRELVGFKLHLPSRIEYHNVRRLEDGEAGEPERGNILTYEQRLSDRRAGTPIAIDVLMGSKSILYSTLLLFAGAFVAAVATLTVVIWLTVRRGRKQARARV